MRYIVIIFVVLVACNPQSNDNLKDGMESKLAGSWGFLDKYGNYNEALFKDSNFVTYNKVYGLFPELKYYLSGDSLFTDADKRKKGLHPIAEIEWINDNKVVFKSEFSSDTLERLIDQEIMLDNTDVKKDSLKYREAFILRYEQMLVDRGITTWEEIRQFKEQGVVPDDIHQKK